MRGVRVQNNRDYFDDGDGFSASRPRRKCYLKPSKSSNRRQKKVKFDPELDNINYKHVKQEPLKGPARAKSLKFGLNRSGLEKRSTNLNPSVHNQVVN
jgi:hypothetical protein